MSFLTNYNVLLFMKQQKLQTTTKYKNYERILKQVKQKKKVFNKVMKLNTTRIHVVFGAKQ